LGPVGGQPELHGAWDLGDEPMLRPAHLQGQLLLHGQHAETLGREPITTLAAERVAHSRTHAGSISHGMLLGAALAWAGYGVEVQLYSPPTIKKHATGNGRASKDQMIEACVDRYGIVSLNTHDEADAICLWYLANDVTRGLTN
jgi:Holliday junction resolvasome RuvABC endonuclease subunit